MKTVSDLLKSKSLTSKQIQRACQVSSATACSWLRGANVPNAKYLKALAELGNIRYSRLVAARQNSKSYKPRKRISTVAATTRHSEVSVDRRCKLMKIAAMYSQLTSDEKVVVSMMADALALLPAEGGE